MSYHEIQIKSGAVHNAHPVNQPFIDRFDNHYERTDRGEYKLKGNKRTKHLNKNFREELKWVLEEVNNGKH